MFAFRGYKIGGAVDLMRQLTEKAAAYYRDNGTGVILISALIIVFPVAESTGRVDPPQCPMRAPTRQSVSTIFANAFADEIETATVHRVWMTFGY